MSTLLVETAGGITTITINRPKALNALNADTMAALDAAVAEAGANAAVRAVILTGAGDKAFVAGADIGELAALDRAGAHEISRRGQALFSRIETLGKPVIAAINGFALGGGCELLLACTVRFASTRAKIGLPEVKLGLIPGYGGTQRLSRLVGRGLALELILTGEFIDAARAADIGLVNAVAEPDDLLDLARAFAEKVLAVGPVAVTHALDAVHRGLDSTLAGGLEIEAERFAALFDTKDAREGCAAFLEKRPPSFTGK